MLRKSYRDFLFRDANVLRVTSAKSCSTAFAGMVVFARYFDVVATLPRVLVAPRTERVTTFASGYPMTKFLLSAL